MRQVHLETSQAFDDFLLGQHLMVLSRYKWFKISYWLSSRWYKRSTEDIFDIFDDVSEMCSSLILNGS